MVMSHNIACLLEDDCAWRNILLAVLKPPKDLTFALRSRYVAEQQKPFWSNYSHSGVLFVTPLSKRLIITKRSDNYHSIQGYQVQNGVIIITLQGYQVYFRFVRVWLGNSIVQCAT